MGPKKNLVKKKSKNKWIRKLTDNPKKILSPFDEKLVIYNSPGVQKMIDDNYGKNIPKNSKKNAKNFGFIRREKILGYSKVVDEKTGKTKTITKKIVEHVYTPSKDFLRQVKNAKYVKKRNMYQEETNKVITYGFLRNVNRTVDNLIQLKSAFPKSKRLVSKEDIDLAFDSNFDVTKVNLKNNDSSAAAANGPKKENMHTLKDGVLNGLKFEMTNVGGVKYCLPILGQQQQKKSKKKKKRKKKKR